MRPDKVQEFIKLIFNDKKVLDVIKILHFQNIFLFMYDIWELANVSSDFPNPGYNVDDFKARTIVAVEFQILLRNFKASKKVDIVKAYLF